MLEMFKCAYRGMTVVRKWLAPLTNDYKDYSRIVCIQNQFWHYLIGLELVLVDSKAHSFINLAHFEFLRGIQIIIMDHRVY